MASLCTYADASFACDPLPTLTVRDDRRSDHRPESVPLTQGAPLTWKPMDLGQRDSGQQRVGSRVVHSIDDIYKRG